MAVACLYPGFLKQTHKRLARCWPDLGQTLEKYQLIVSALNYRTPPEIARVEFSTRTKLPGGFGGPGDMFSNDRNSGKATTATTTKKHPQDHQNHQAI